MIIYQSFNSFNYIATGWFFFTKLFMIMTVADEKLESMIISHLLVLFANVDFEFFYKFCLIGITVDVGR